MTLEHLVRTSVCALAVGLSACGSGHDVGAAPSPEEQPRSACVAFAAGAQVTSVQTDDCVGCSSSDLDYAADGDTSTFATMTLTAAAGGGTAIRVSQPSKAYPAGQATGMLVRINRNATTAANPYAFLRTYLGEALQEEFPLTATSGVGSSFDVANNDAILLHSMATIKPYDAIEFALQSAATAGDYAVDVFEACGKVLSPEELHAGDTFGLGYKQSPVVIADLSTGANPYHQVFRRPDWTQHPSTVIPGFPVDAPALNLTLGPDLADDEELDRQKWLDMQPGVVYWIPGTNLLYLRTRYADEAFPGADHDDLPYETANHGTLTSGVIADACPDCYLLIVSDPEGGFTYSLDFIARNTPWVDVAASTQHATQVYPESAEEIATALLLSGLMGPLSEYASAAKRWAGTGRLYFVGSGNFPISSVGYPLPVPTSDRSLPPWFTLVGGAYAECRASEANAGRPTEFASEYAAVAPANNSIYDYQDVSGTSFSTPLVATRFAQALKRVRAQLGDTREQGVYWSGTPQNSSFLADGVLTRDELYQAFAQAADLFQADQYTGPCGGNSVPVSPQPWLEMGWGYVGPNEAELAADLILGLRQAPAKPAEQSEYMDAYLSAREAAGSVTP